MYLEIICVFLGFFYVFKFFYILNVFSEYLKIFFVFLGISYNFLELKCIFCNYLYFWHLALTVVQVADKDP